MSLFEWLAVLQSAVGVVGLILQAIDVRRHKTKDE